MKGLLSGILAGALLCAAGCGSRPEIRGIVLVTLDTTRADRIGCYGYPDAATPALDDLARNGTRFEYAVSPVPITLPSHASMFTGRYPYGHGVRYNGMFKLSPEAVTVAELLKSAGWATVGVPAAFPVATTTGLGQGFEVYRDLFVERRGEQPKKEAQRRAEEISAIGIEWIRSHRDARFFLWLHYYDPHDPYDPPFPYSAKYRDRPYDGEIAYADAELGKFLSELRSLGRDRDTAVLIAGDHGEGLFDHGEQQHANLVYESTLRVPFVAAVPGGAKGRVVAEPVSLVDVAPTILDLAGVAIPAGLNGVSLAPVLRGTQPGRRDLYFESLSGSLLYGWSPLEGVRQGSWKLIRSNGSELYDLASDPEEKADARGRAPGKVDELTASLEGLLRSASGASTTAESPTLSPDAIRQLASLGYVGLPATSAHAGGPNPRDMVHLERTLLMIRDQMDTKQYEDALSLIGAVLKEDPGNRFGWLESMDAWSGLGDVDRATRAGEELTRRYPESDLGFVRFGEMLVSHGRYERAAEAFREGFERHPGKPELRYRYVLALVATGRIDEASRQADEALSGSGAGEFGPSFLLARALCRAKQGNPAGARAALAEAIAKGYADRDVLEMEPMLAPLRAVPGFADEVSKIGAGGPPKGE